MCDLNMFLTGLLPDSSMHIHTQISVLAISGIWLLLVAVIVQSFGSSHIKTWHSYIPLSVKAPAAIEPVPGLPALSLTRSHAHTHL